MDMKYNSKHKWQTVTVKTYEISSQSQRRLCTCSLEERVGSDGSVLTMESACIGESGVLICIFSYVIDCLTSSMRFSNPQKKSVFLQQIFIL